MPRKPSEVLRILAGPIPGTQNVGRIVTPLADKTSAKKAREMILAMLAKSGPASPHEIAEDLGLERRDVLEHMRLLRSGGHVVREWSRKGDVVKWRVAENE